MNLIVLLMNHLFNYFVVIHSVFESIVWIGVGVCSRNCVFERGKAMEKNIVNLSELLMNHESIVSFCYCSFNQFL